MFFVCFCFVRVAAKLVNLGKSITDFSVEGADDAKKEDMEQDDDHEKLDEEMGKRARGRNVVIAN